MNKFLPVKMTGGIVMDPATIITSVLNLLTQLQIQKERELTARTMYREKSKICIAQIEHETERIRLSQQISHEERMKIISIVASLVNRDKIDNEVMAMCDKLLAALVSMTPSKYMIY